MPITLKSSEILAIRISKQFIIQINDKEIIVNKYTNEDEFNTDADTEIDFKSKAIYDSLTEEEQEQFDDFILDLPMLTNQN